MVIGEVSCFVSEKDYYKIFGIRQIQSLSLGEQDNLD